jgi:hypothetical protein
MWELKADSPSLHTVPAKPQKMVLGKAQPYFMSKMSIVLLMDFLKGG